MGPEHTGTANLSYRPPRTWIYYRYSLASGSPPFFSVETIINRLRGRFKNKRNKNTRFCCYNSGPPGNSLAEEYPGAGAGTSNAAAETASERAGPGFVPGRAGRRQTSRRTV